MSRLRVHVGVRLLVWLAMGAFSVVGCASAGGSARDIASGDGSTWLFPLPKGDAAEIEALPRVSTFSWVPPSWVYSDMSLIDDEQAMSVSTAGLREAASAVLRENGWRETSPDSTSFYLALIAVERTGMRSTSVPDKRDDMWRPNVCEGLETAQREACREPRTPTYPPTSTMTPFSETRVAFAIVRVHDQARRSWLVRRDGMNAIARGTAELLDASMR